MEKVSPYLEKLWFSRWAVLIVVLAGVLRFYNYPNRWGLAVDQASFALLTRYALFNQKLPLLGQFTSAGPFQTGGEWYWFLMIAQAFYPFSLLTPWVVMTFVYILFVALFMVMSKDIFSKRVALIAGLFAAVSTSQIEQGFNLSNQSPLPILSLIAIWIAISYIRHKKTLNLFLLGVCVGAAPTFHTQGFLLMPLPVITLILAGRFRIKDICYLVLGLFLPWIPIFIADSDNNFRNTQNMIQYYLKDQYKISLDVLGRNWKTYLSIFWPSAWANIIGGIAIIGYMQIIVVIIVGAYSLYRRIFTKEWLLIVFTFLSMVFILRYTRVPLFDSNLLLTHVCIFLLFAGVMDVIIKKNKFIGYVMIAVIISGSLYANINNIMHATNYTAARSEFLRYNLISKYPDDVFSLYDFQSKTLGISQPLTLFIDEKNKISDKGKKIGVLYATSSASLQYPVIFKETGQVGIYLVSLDHLQKDDIAKDWESVNPSAVYRNVQEWYTFKK